MKKKVLAIISARKNSKSIKNIKYFNVKPLIYWIINSAIKSKNIINVVVSVDSKNISKISKKLGTNILFLRPKKLFIDMDNILDWKFSKLLSRYILC